MENQKRSDIKPENLKDYSGFIVQNSLFSFFGMIKYTIKIFLDNILV